MVKTAQQDTPTKKEAGAGAAQDAPGTNTAVEVSRPAAGDRSALDAWGWPWGTRAWPGFDEMERLMSRMAASAPMPAWMKPADWPASMLGAWSENAALPRLDVLERDEELLVRAELPGAKREDIDVSVGNGRLTIRCSSREEKTDEEGDFHRRETRRHALQRTVTLPAPVDDDKAEARLEGGILEIRLPKSGDARRRKVPVG